MFNYIGLGLVFQFVLGGILYDLAVINSDKIIEVLITSAFNLLVILPTLYTMIKARLRKSNEIIFKELAVSKAENKWLKEQIQIHKNENKTMHEELLAEIYSRVISKI